VERVVLNALAKHAASPPEICACGDRFAIGPSRTGIFGEANSPAMLWHLRDLPFAAETAPLQLSIL